MLYPDLIERSPDDPETLVLELGTRTGHNFGLFKTGEGVL